MLYGGSQGKFFDRLGQIPLVLPSPSLTLMDGIIAMHQTGPIWGQPYPLSLVAASTNPVAMDTALHRILHLPAEICPVMAACCRAGLNGAELSQLTFPLLRPEEIQASGFIVPEQLSPVRFDLFRFLKSSAYRVLLQKQRSG
jgi:uncharacterized protein (DUF362 family)